MYKVVTFFYDLQDNARVYHVGDTFPHDGVEVGAERFAYLASNGNKLGVPVIEEVKEKRSRKTKQ